MALTITDKALRKLGNAYAVVADVTFGASYPTGGESLTPAQFGLSVIDLMLIETSTGYLFQYDYTNSKLKAFYPRAAVAGTLAVATPALAHTATGSTPVLATDATMPDHAAGVACTITGNPAVAAGAGAEVTNKTDLHTITARVMAIGV